MLLNPSVNTNIHIKHLESIPIFSQYQYQFSQYQYHQSIPIFTIKHLDHNELSLCIEYISTIFTYIYQKHVYGSGTRFTQPLAQTKCDGQVKLSADGRAATFSRRGSSSRAKNAMRRSLTRSADDEALPRSEEEEQDLPTGRMGSLVF